MYCAGPFWNGWGMPWIMLLMPFLMLTLIFLACRFVRPRFGALCGCGPLPAGRRATEIRALRREVAELRQELKSK